MKQILNIAIFETKQIGKDKLLLLIVLVLSMLYASLFGLIYKSAVLNNVPLGLVDLDQSSLSRDIVTAFANDPHFNIIRSIDSYEQLEAGMKTGTVRAGVVIPEDYAAELSMHRATEVLTVYDASNLIWGLNVRRYVLEVVNQYSTQYAADYLAGLGFTPQEISATLDTISCRIQVLYNPTYSYATFMLMGLFLLILHQIGLLCIGLTITREKERNTWIQYLASAIPAWKIAIGKMLPYCLASLFNYGLLLWSASYLFNAKVGGSTVLVWGLGLVFILAITALGFFLSVHAANSLQLSRWVMLLSVPLFFLSGYTWPKTHIPGLLNWLAALFPYNWITEAMRMVTLKNVGPEAIQLHALVLCVMAGLAILAATTFSKNRTPPTDSGTAVNTGVVTPRES